MPTDRPTSIPRTIGAAISVGVATAVIVELVGHLAGGGPTTTAVAGGAIVMATGIGATFKKRKGREGQPR